MNTIPQVKYFITEIGTSLSGNPIAIGWDYCKCGSHIVNCTCVGGPTEPKYITAMREKELALALALAKEKELAKPAPTPVVSAPEPPAVPLATQVAADEYVSQGAHKCNTCDKVVSEQDADQNDDGTYTCHTCQEAS